MQCLKKVHFWWSVVILALRVLKMYTLLVKIVPKRIKKNCNRNIRMILIIDWRSFTGPRTVHTEDWINGYWKFSFVITRINYILTQNDNETEFNRAWMLHIYHINVEHRTKETVGLNTQGKIIRETRNRCNEINEWEHRQNSDWENHDKSCVSTIGLNSSSPLSALSWKIKIIFSPAMEWNG